MTSTINTGLIGYGMAGKILHAPLINATLGLRLCGVATSKPDALKADWPDARAYVSPEDLINDPDIDLIVIASPNQTHAPLAEMALHAGKHVIIDKPFALSNAEAQLITALAQSRQLVLSAFHNRRWDSDFLTIQKLLQSGALGRLTQMTSAYNRYRPAIRQRWREDKGPGAGLWCDLGSHLIDQALVLFGAPDSLQLDLAIQRDGAEVDDWFHCVLHYGSLRVILHADVLSAEVGPRFQLNGTHGSYVKYGLDPQEIALGAGIPPVPEALDWGKDDREGMLTLKAPEESATPYPSECGDWRKYYAGMVSAIRDGAPAPRPCA